MYISQTEENRNKAISATVTAIIFALLLLFLILYRLITPNPPFPITGGGGGQELALGMVNLGNDNVEYGKMGTVTDVVTENKAETAPPTKAEENVLTDPGGEAVNIKENKPEEKKNTTVIVPVKPVEKPKELTEAEKLALKFKKNAGKTGGGIGDNDQAGQNGDPNGSPDKNGNGGHGNGDGGGDGDGKGPGSGPGSGPGIGNKYGVDLKGRAIVVPPQLPKDTKEEGKVVVEITVDTEGKVIEANPNGRGTTTSSRILKEKAKMAALATKFNVDGKFEEQRGTITIVFAFE